MRKDIEKIRQRFCKDNNISLQIFSSPYFEERLKLFGFLDKYNEFISFIDSTFHSIEEYFEYYNKLKDSIIDYIKNSEAFQKLNSDDMNKYPKYQIKQSDVYKPSNIGKKFISIDMRKANFTSLVRYSKYTNTSFFNSYDYNEFIRQFTSYEYFVDSKYIRQVVFGNCNPKRQITFESFLMSNFLTDLMNTLNINLNQIYSLCSDEIIIEIDDSIDINKIIDYCKKFNDFPIKCEVFTLAKLRNTDAYMKIIDNDKPVLKCVNPYEAPFIYRFMNNEEYKESDSLFIFNNKLAKILEVPNISIQLKEENI